MSKYNVIERITASLCAALLFCAIFSCGTARADAIDPEAVQALERCAEYVECNPFSARMRGAIRTRVFGIPCKQTVESTREVDGKKYHAYDESKSAFVNIAFDRVSDGATHSVRTAEYKKKKFVFGAPKAYSDADYISRFGKPPVSLCKFDISGNITGARRVSDDTYVFTLSPRAGEPCLNMIKSLADAKSAQYRYIELTLVTDGQKPIELSSTEKFTVEKLGGLKCAAEFTEVFDY